VLPGKALILKIVIVRSVIYENVELCMVKSVVLTEKSEAVDEVFGREE
jgi:hypothetical protein